MSKNALHITLHSTLSENGQSGETILQSIQTIRRSVAQLRDKNLDLERIRDQYIIHLQQCQEDHNILRTIYKKLKMKLDMSRNDINGQNGQAQQGIASQNEAAKAMQPTAPVAKKMPTIEFNAKITSNVSYTQASAPKIQLRYSLNTTSPLSAIKISNDGSKIAFTDGSFIYLIKAVDGDVLNSFEINPPVERDIPMALCFSPDNQLVAVSGANNDVHLYSIETGKILHTFVGHTKEVSSILFNNNGSWL